MNKQTKLNSITGMLQERGINALYMWGIVTIFDSKCELVIEVADNGQLQLRLNSTNRLVAECLSQVRMLRLVKENIGKFHVVNDGFQD